MNLLIVDDEYYIVKGIVKEIDTDKLGVSNIFTAYSKEQAVKILEKEEIDILLSDIEMPRGSGLELVQFCADNGMDPVTLLLTGHQNFDYIQKAIQMRCLDYLLKPLRKDQLNDHLKSAIEEVGKKREAANNAEEAALWRGNSRLRAASFWSHLLSDEIGPERDAVSRYIEEQEIPPEWLDRTYSLCLFKIQRNPAADDKTARIKSSIYEILSAEKLITPDDLILKLADTIFVLPATATSEMSFGHFCNKLEKTIPRISERTGCNVSVYISENCSIDSASDCLKELQRVESDIKTIGNRLIAVETLKKEKTLYNPSAGSLKDIPFREWSERQLQHRPDLILRDLKNRLEEDHKYLSSGKLVLLYHGLIYTVLYSFSQKGLDGECILPDITNTANLDRAISSSCEFMAWAESILSESGRMLKAEEDSSSLVKRVSGIVNANLSSDNLTRVLIAEELHMNPDYLSYLFHKKSGQSLISYINSRRIGKAKELLLSTDRKMTDIAETVGYFNTPYFYRQFKKVTGLTPKQFRDVLEK